MTKMTLRALRANYGFTQEEIAKKIDISPSTWSKWENGRSYPDVLYIQKIEEVFNVSYADIKFLPTSTV